MAKEKALTKEEAKIINLWELGYSGTQIAQELGTTRNAVMGKIFRLRRKAQMIYGHDKMKNRAVLEVEVPQAKPKKAKVPKMPPKHKVVRNAWKPTPDPSKVLKPTKGVSFWDLSFGGCRYPVGGEKLSDMIFCDALATKGSFCAEHYAICFVPVNRKSEDKKSAFNFKRVSGAS